MGALGDILQGISNLPSKIIEGFTDFFDSVGDFFDNFTAWFTDLPNKITDILKSIFVPDEGYIEEAFDDFLADLKTKFGINTDVFYNLFNSSTPVDDVEGNYTIHGLGNFNFKFLDASFLRDGVAYFRPFIRGFLVLLLFLYNIKQALSFFGFDAGFTSGHSEQKALPAPKE